MIIEAMGEKFIGMMQDESRGGGNADFVAIPKNTEDVVQVLKHAAKSNMGITIQGAATGIAGGAVPLGGILVSMREMNDILGVREDDGQYFLRVQSGVTLNQITEYLRKPLHENTSYFFPHNPTEKTATVGGAFACNSAGMNCIAYGSFSTLISYIEWLAPDGDVWKIPRGDFLFDKEGCPLPNGLVLDFSIESSIIPAQLPNIGSDLIDFLAGSESRLGIVTELELALSPVLQEHWGALFLFTDDSSPWLFANNLNKNFLVGCEYYDDAVLKLMRENHNDIPLPSCVKNMPNDTYNAVYIEIAGNDDEATQEYLAEILEIFLDCGGSDDYAFAVNGASEIERLRLMYHACPELINLEASKVRRQLPELIKYSLDIKVPKEELPKLLAMCRQEANKFDIHLFVAGHMLLGQVVLHIVPQTTKCAEQCPLLLEKLATLVTDVGGYIAAENGIGKNKMELVWNLMSVSQKEYYTQLKQLFDPVGVMNRGRQ